MHVRNISALLFLAALMLCGGPPARTQNQTGTDGHAKAILDQARAALGGESALKAIRSLSASGTFIIGEGEHRVSGKLNLDWLLPAKFMRTMKWSLMQTVQITTIEAVNGATVWTDSRASQANPLASVGGMGGGGMGRGGMGRGGSRSGGTGGAGGSGGGSRSGGPAPGLRENVDSPEFQEQMRADLDCLSVALFLAGTDFLPEEFVYAGEIEIANVKADSLKVKAAGGITYTLAIDQKTHRPFMVEYQMPASQAPLGVQYHSQDQADDGQGGESGAKPADIQIYFSDYRPIQEKRIGQVWLPHQIDKSSNGQPVEDFSIDSFKLNPTLKPEQFEKKR